MAVSDSTRHAHNFKDLTGRIFGRLVVMSFAGRNRNGRAIWKCRCDCKTECIVAGSSLTRDTPVPTRSCGCLQRETTGDRFRTHGMGHCPEHNVWALMIGRCCNEHNHRYLAYGGRGISVCERWRNSFQAFYDDMGPRPSARHEIDRKNNDGNYGPDNCRWATRTEQARNKRNNRMLTLHGKTQCMAAWAEDRDIALNTLWRRLKLGWTTERALATPVRNTQSKETVQ